MAAEPWVPVETDLGDGTKRVRMWNDDGDLVYDMVADADTVFRDGNG